MAERPQEHFTVSYRSEDAHEATPGEYTFESRGVYTSKKPVKIALASCEFDISQYSIEEDWSRVYFMERTVPRFAVGARTLSFAVTEPAQHGATTVVDVTLPLPSNPIVDMRFNSVTRQLSITTEHPHGLWSNGRSLAAEWETWGERCRIAAAPFGEVSLTEAAKAGQLFPTDDPREFRLTHTPRPSATALAAEPSPIKGVVLCPAPPSLAHLARVLTAALQSSMLGARGASGVCDDACGTAAPLQAQPHVRYDAEANVFAFEIGAYPNYGDTARVAVSGDRLAQALGFVPGFNERAFERNVRHVSSVPRNGDLLAPTRPLLERTQGIDGVERGDACPLRVQGCPIRWPYVDLRPGHYGPSKRNFGAGQPRRISSEVELQFNRFVLQAHDDGGPAIVVVDTRCAMHAIPLDLGRYSASTMAQMLTDKLREAEGPIQVAFRDGRFVFVADEPFSLLFNHPQSIDATRLGFEALPYEGARAYSGAVVHAPSPPPSNVYGVVEEPAQQKFRLVVMGPPPLIARYVARALGRAVLETFQTGRAAAHGLSVGDTVRLCKPATADVAIGSDTVGTFDPRGALAYVTAVPTRQSVHVLVPDATWLATETQKACTLRVAVEPANFYFGDALPRGIETRLGFERRAVEYLKDGLYQFVAPHVYNLEHPDYVLLHLKDLKRSTTNVHHGKDAASTPLCKIVLFPTVRDERGLTRECLLPSGENMARFTLYFTTPDGRRYHHHGARWSCSLNCVVVG